MSKILLIGSGGREHALAKKIAESPKLTELFIAPGNPGTAQFGKNVMIAETDFLALLSFAKSQEIDLTVVGPEGPLVGGIVDLFESEGLRIIGPSKAAAQLEGSKHWSKEFMKKYHIPTAHSQTFTHYAAASDYIRNKNTYPIVIKADGLAAGKGVSVAPNFESADQALQDALVNDRFKEAGRRVVIEDFLPGEEASILAFIDGKTIIPMASAQDHKAVFDGDQGPNTGGMGAYSPAKIVTESVLEQVQSTILNRVLFGLQAENISYKGIIYAGLMIHNGIPSVVEFNVRFGDPETQVVLPRLDTDILDIFDAIVTQTLATQNIQWAQTAAICVVLASKGYPGPIETGFPILGLSDLTPHHTTHVIHAGTRYSDDQQLVSSGGRVLGVVTQEKTLKAAIQSCYSAISDIHFEGMHYRHDIGQKALV